MDIDAFYKITQGLYILGADDNGRSVGSVIDAVMQVANVPLVLAISCHNGSYTKSCIEKNGRFSLSALPKDISSEIIRNFGFCSSKTVDKWLNVEHTIIDGLPYLTDSIALFSCEVIQTIVYESNTLILGRVSSAYNNQDKEPITYQYYRTNLRKSIPIQAKENEMTEVKEKHWVCTVCGYVYDGDVPFEDLPEDWVCPLCGVDKSYFVYE